MEAFEIFKEKTQPARELLEKIKHTTNRDPVLLKAEKLQDLKAARAHELQYLTDAREVVRKNAAQYIQRINLEIAEIEEKGPYIEVDARGLALRLQFEMEEAERWAYIAMLFDLLDAFTTLTYWEDLQLEAIQRGYEYFNLAKWKPEHWKLSRHSETEIKLLALVEEITQIVQEEGEDLTNEIHS